MTLTARQTGHLLKSLRRCSHNEKRCTDRHRVRTRLRFARSDFLQRKIPFNPFFKAASTPATSVQNETCLNDFSMALFRQFTTEEKSESISSIAGGCQFRLVPAMSLVTSVESDRSQRHSQYKGRPNLRRNPALISLNYRCLQHRTLLLGSQICLKRPANEGRFP